MLNITKINFCNSCCNLFEFMNLLKKSKYREVLKRKKCCPSIQIIYVIYKYD